MEQIEQLRLESQRIVAGFERITNGIADLRARIQDDLKKCKARQYYLRRKIAKLERKHLLE